MSLKSHKSSNDDCSELLEATFSFKSGSVESLTCNDDEEEDSLARELMFKLTPVILSKLRRRFRKTKQKDQAKDIDRRIEEVMRLAAAEEGLEFSVSSRQEPLWMDRMGFQQAMSDVFGHNKYKTHTDHLFTLLDPFHTGRVKWGQLINKMVAVGAKQTRSVAEKWKSLEVARVIRLEHCQRETIVKIVSIEKENSCCLCVISRGGRVGVYSGAFHLLHKYQVFYQKTGSQRRVKNSWITDAVYLNDVECLAVSASDRSLTIYDAATLVHTPSYCITGLKYIPICMSYCSSSSSSILALGMELGDVIILRFLQPKISLFCDKSQEKTNYYFWKELMSPTHANFVSITTLHNVHSCLIRRLALFKDVLVTSAKDPNVSVCVKYLDGRLPDYVYKIPGGVSSFHALSRGSLVVCTSPRGLFLCASGRSVKLCGGTGEVRVERETVYTYDKDCCLFIWDMNEECLLQKIKINFPFLGLLGKKVEFGPYCLFQGPPRRAAQPPVARQHPPPGASPPVPALPAPSSRRSSVAAGAGGGLRLEEEQEAAGEEDEEISRFTHPEMLITTGDYVCILNLEKNPTESGELLPPPGNTLRARRPSFWDLPDDVFTGYPSTLSTNSSEEPVPITSISTSTTASPAISTPLTVNNQFLSPSSAETHLNDLDTLLENAGLQGILEKDFVLMHGLHHDLNKKLAEMNADMEAMRAAVNMEAVYLAVKIVEPVPVAPADELVHKYRQVMKLFPAPSAANTPTGSNTSTLTKRNSLKHS